MFSDYFQQVTSAVNTFKKSSVFNQIVFKITDTSQEADRTVNYLNENDQIVNFLTFNTRTTTFTSSKHNN